MKRLIRAVDDTYEFLQLKSFKREFKKLGLNEDDLQELKLQLISEEPEANLGHNAYKFRWAPSKWNTGQSGATRVVYIDVIKTSRAYLVSIYRKNQKSDLTKEEYKLLKKLGDEYSKGGN